jgi:multicomponent Na+:H+ antiporter subunit D
MNIAAFPPSLLLMVTAVLVAVTTTRRTRSIGLAGIAITAMAVGLLPTGQLLEVGFMKYTVALVSNDATRSAAAWAVLAGAALAVFLSPFLDGNDRRSAVAGLLSAAFGLGVIFSGDLIAIFLQWELLALTITALIFMAGTEQARAAGIRFLLLQLTGGFLFKYGMHGYEASFGSYLLSAATQPVFEIPGGWALIAGACIKLGAWPVAMVLPDAARHIARSGSPWLGIALPLTALIVLNALLAPLPTEFIALGLVMIAYAIVYGIAARAAMVRMARIGVGLTGLALALAASGSETLAWAITWLIPGFYALGFFLAAGASAGQTDHESRKAEVLVDSDWLWRTGLFRVARALAQIAFGLRDVIAQTGFGMVMAVQRLARQYSGIGGLLSRTWGIGYTAIWVIGLLALYAMIYLTL